MTHSVTDICHRRAIRSANMPDRCSHTVPIPIGPSYFKSDLPDL